MMMLTVLQKLEVHNRSLALVPQSVCSFRTAKRPSNLRSLSTSYEIHALRTNRQKTISFLPSQCLIDRSKFIFETNCFICRKGYISTDDLKEVFEILGESITDDEVNTMIKIAGVKSNDKINFKEFVDFFYKID